MQSIPAVLLFPVTAIFVIFFSALFFLGFIPEMPAM
jgi:hypothetical protein